METLNSINDDGPHLPHQKFQNPKITLEGKPRAFVAFNQFKTLWFNTGTLCNLECKNCYIESGPRNNNLSFLNLHDTLPFLDELALLDENRKTQIGLTGGEPFLNPHIIEIIEECLKRDHQVLVLTNGYRVLDRYKKQILQLNQFYPKKMTLRISLDHYQSKIHNNERQKEDGFEKTLLSLQWLEKQKITYTIASRSLKNETHQQSLQGHKKLLKDYKLSLDLDQPENLIIFPEMEMRKNSDIPEISTECWAILNQSPNQQMCSSERMVVKRKEALAPAVLACTLLAYDPRFELGSTLNESIENPVSLNHKFCSEFCVLGGASCSG